VIKTETKKNWWTR